MDVVLTKDGEVLVCHDPILNPDIVRNSSGQFIAKNKEAVSSLNNKEREAFQKKFAVINQTLSELKKYDVGRINPQSSYARFFPNQQAVDGTQMPTLREVIQYVSQFSQNQVGFQIEMKTDPTLGTLSANPQSFAKAIYKILSDEKVINRSEIQAFDFRCLYELQKIDSQVKTAYLTSRDLFQTHPKLAGLWTEGKLVKDYGNSLPQMVKALGGFAWEPEDTELSKESLAEAKKLGLKVVVWSWPEKVGTAFDIKTISLMIDWGVDGIITDDPKRLNSLLAAKGLPTPSQFKTE
jgi:glycerophosphoryl diester phosphodiesterase